MARGGKKGKKQKKRPPQISPYPPNKAPGFFGGGEKGNFPGDQKRKKTPQKGNPKQPVFAQKKNIKPHQSHGAPKNKKTQKKNFSFWE